MLNFELELLKSVFIIIQILQILVQITSKKIYFGKISIKFSFSYYITVK